MAEWSTCLLINQDVAVLIPCIFTILNVDLVWNGVHPASRGQRVELIDWEEADRIRKVDINIFHGA